MRAIKAAQRRAATAPPFYNHSPPPASSLPALRDVNGMLSHHSVNFGVVESGVEALHSCVARCHLQQYGGWGGGFVELEELCCRNERVKLTTKNVQCMPVRRIDSIDCD